jgi:hypothetical protein
MTRYAWSTLSSKISFVKRGILIIADLTTLEKREMLRMVQSQIKWRITDEHREF